jgi:hypothetical protein
LHKAFDFVEVEYDQNVAFFTIELDDSVPAGSYAIEVLATDYLGNEVFQTFTIYVNEIIEEYIPPVEIEVVVNEDVTVEPLKARIESVSLSGLMTIEYNRRVVPLTNVTWVSTNEFYMRFEQTSDEID